MAQSCKANLKLERAFLAQFNGKFVSALRWPQLDLLWGVLRSDPEGWYIYQVGESLPEQPLSNLELLTFVDEVDCLLRQEHDETYCGIVYANDFNKPTMIKVYDPGNLGASCGSSGRKIMPRWVLSQIQPIELYDEGPVPGNRRRWWSRLFGA